MALPSPDLTIPSQTETSEKPNTQLPAAQAILDNYIKEFNGDMVLSEASPPENLDRRLFTENGEPTEDFIGIIEDIQSWVGETLKNNNFMLSLIGTYASGRQRQSSDIDIHVTVPGISTALRNRLIEALFDKVNAPKMSDEFTYEKEAGALDFIVQPTPPLGTFFNLSLRKWQKLGLKS